MLEQELTSGYNRFTNGVIRSYPHSVDLKKDFNTQGFVANSSRNYRRSRKLLVQNLFEGNHPAIQPQAFAMEHLVHLALRNPLTDTGFSITSAPQTLERSDENQKGVDLLITDNNHVIYLGIDVKLRTSRSIYQRDGFGWNKNVLSPYIYLSLGNFRVDMWEQSDISVLEWLQQYAVPKIGSSGKIPNWDCFQMYLIGRIERSIQGSLEFIEHYGEQQLPFRLPNNKEEKEIFVEKLAIMKSLFFDLQ